MLSKGQLTFHRPIFRRSRKVPAQACRARLRVASQRYYCTTTARAESLLARAYRVLSTPDPKEKSRLTIEAHEWLRSSHPKSKEEELQLIEGSPTGKDADIRLNALDSPARPEKPTLVEPRLMPGYRQLQVPMATYLLHGLAHIELNAIDMVWDTILRFYRSDVMPLDFYRDFVSIAYDEARHFSMLCERLVARESYYGAIPAHDGLWRAAYNSRHDLKTRIANIQLVQEARALDSWERLVTKLRSQGDVASSKLVDLICREEIAHVRAGVRWFEFLCQRDNLDPISTFHKLVAGHNVLVPPPFNTAARSEAGLRAEYYEPLAKKPEQLNRSS